MSKQYECFEVDFKVYKLEFVSIVSFPLWLMSTLNSQKNDGIKINNVIMVERCECA